MKIDLFDFEMAVMNSDVSGEYYGEYNGRDGHKGYAVRLNSEDVLFELGVLCATNHALRPLAEHAPHIATQDLWSGVIVSWPARLFDVAGETN